MFQMRKKWVLRECRSSKYALPKPEKSSRVNKFCEHCKKSGHSRNECWSLNGRSRNSKDKFPEIKKKTREEKIRAQAKQRQRKRDSESISSSSENEQEEAGRKKSRPALEYCVAHMRDTPYAHKHGSIISKTTCT